MASSTSPTQAAKEPASNMGHEQTTTPPPSGSSDREPVPAGPAAGPDECDVVVEGPAGGPPSSGGGSGVVSARAIARFEFEESKGNEGTKVLLVEWDASSPSSSSGNKDEASENTGDWEIAWEGKTTVLPAVDATLAGPGGTPSSWRRVFFLLPPGAPVPPLVTISRTRKPGASDANADEPTETLRATPLPAIFVPALGVSSRDVGRRGVLHTIWAKRRLAELEREVDAEMRANGESVGLEMALQERRWILEHFGLGEPSAPSASTPDNQAQQSQQPLPQSPRSPISGRLGEKLKGLKLATSPADLTPAHSDSQLPPDSRTFHLQSLSPGPGDVAVSSFASFRGPRPAVINGRTQALDAVLRGDVGSKPQPASAAPHHETKGADVDEEDLFALPMSPRSPDMAKSPFSMLKTPAF